MRGAHRQHVRPWAGREADHLDLRDRLCESATDRALYAATKRDLAQRAWFDRNDYADAK